MPRPADMHAGSLVPGLVAVVGVTAWSFAPALPAVKVDGQYKIVSTDCYFAAGGCKATFDIEQSGTKLSDPSDKYFHGHVHGTTVHFGEQFPLGTIEDSWSCSGTTSDGGHTIKGTMTDGIGGSGTFVLTYKAS